MLSCSTKHLVSQLEKKKIPAGLRSDLKPLFFDEISKPKTFLHRRNHPLPSPSKAKRLAPQSSSAINGELYYQNLET